MVNQVLKISKEELFEKVSTYLATNNASQMRLSRTFELRGQRDIIGCKFIGHDEDWEHAMLYRIDKYEHNSGHPRIIISDLTLDPTERHPALKENKTLDLSLHLDDFNLVDLNLKKIAKAIGLSTDNFHWYV